MDNLKVRNFNFKNHVVNEQIIKGFKWFDPKLRLGLGIILGFSYKVRVKYK